MNEEKNKNNMLEECLEDEKQELVRIAYDKFGTDYFDKLEELTKDYSIESEPNKYRFSLKVSNIGAFNAS